MKKVSIIAIALVSAMALMIGCGPKEESKADASKQAKGTPQKTSSQKLAAEENQ